ncbi:hypothetical protein PS843_03798 [Pseudomonas fluorescens]|nr:hypothetical protein PS843_03798 [Pseudomonas fluorescens]
MSSRQFKISISNAYFLAIETKTDFLNRIGRLLPAEKGCNRPISIDQKEHPAINVNAGQPFVAAL